jgi:hypothetical protein
MVMDPTEILGVSLVGSFYNSVCGSQQPTTYIASSYGYANAD